MAAIIKTTGRASETAAQTAAHAFQFDDVGQAYLGYVRGEAARIIAEARREAQKIKSQAAEEGKQAALQAIEASVRARFDQQLKQAVAAVQQAARGVAQARHAWQQHWERHAVAVAIAIARRTCRGELTLRPEITLAWIREALALAAGSEEITLRLNPDDLGTLAVRIEDLVRNIQGLGAVRIVADDSVSLGGCRVETAFGSLDQQLEAQLDRIREELLE